MKKNKLRYSKSAFFKGLNQALLGLFAMLVFAGFLWATDAISKPELPQQGMPGIFYSNQARNDLRHTMSQAIQEAKQSVVLIVYTLTDSAIIQALNDKSDQGVAVKVICDGRACPFMERKLKPAIQLIKRFGEGLMHLKLLVVDDAKVWIGSANMTNESLSMHGNLIAAFEHPDLAELVLTKSRGLPEEGRSVPAIPHQTFNFKDQSMEFWLLPDDRGAVERVKQIIRSAKKSIRVAMFTWTRFDFAQEIVAAAARGVKAEVILDHYSGKGVSSKVANYLKSNGILFGMSQGKALLHHKFMIIDDVLLVNGSANWTKAAFTTNDDCFFVLSEMTEQQLHKMNLIWDTLKSEAAP
jgi:phosphatidylserine/phosphatidylglycerophosphate/cardiolipin synthase-like enzyme